MTSYRVQVLTAQIRLLEQELLGADAAQPDSLNALHELKRAVDGMRATLWCCLDGKHDEVPVCPEEIKLVRMNRVVEMFRTSKSSGRREVN